TAAPSSIPPRVAPQAAPQGDAPSASSTQPTAVKVPEVAPPTSRKPGCPDARETRMLLWAWNAQQGLLFANGGTQATEGSLMGKSGVNLKLSPQDAVDQMQAELVKCASELAKGHHDCTARPHFLPLIAPP